MRITREDLQKLAHLARLEFEKKDEGQMIESLNEIIDWVEQLNEVDTDGLEPITSMSHEVNVTREDEVKEHLDHEKGLQSAPKRDKDYFKVPKVIE
jgi:aspartyl-tRNA(Asn)/glutamyl-tRNA(Gln) amidotransferase subunit C